MDNIKYKSKLEDLEIGDKVAISRRWNGVSIGIVENITPKGFIRVDGILFDKSGYERGGDVWAKCSILPLTEKLHNEIINERIITKAHKTMRYFSKDKIAVDIAKKILNLLEDIE